MSWFFFLCVLAVCLACLAVYVHRRAAHAFRLTKRGRRVLAGLLTLGLVMLFGARFLSRTLGGSDLAYEIVAVIGTCISLGMLMAAGLLFHVDALRLMHWLARRGLRKPMVDEAPVEGEKLPQLMRREMLKTTATGAAIAIGGSAASYAALFGRHDYEIEEVPVPIEGLSRRLDGYTIVQLSDIHFGTFVQQQELETALQLIAKAQPDLVVLTGDLLDHDPAYTHYLGQLVRRASELARDGVAAIPGNHDHYAGVREVTSTLERAGAKVMLNRGRVIGDEGGAFALLGIDDPTGFHDGMGPDLARAVSMVPDDLPRILLSHRPELFDDTAPQVQLQLSGHTHGGQVSLIYNPAQLVLPHRYIRGLYEKDGSRIYVNRGFGTAGPPARLGSAPEVTKIVLLS